MQVNLTAVLPSEQRPTGAQQENGVQIQLQRHFANVAEALNAFKATHGPEGALPTYSISTKLVLPAQHNFHSESICLLSFPHVRSLFQNQQLLNLAVFMMCNGTC